ncbi:DNA repair protein RecO [Longimicrobium sp.]|uniref:DNA repair protein RecO n=1 Tax=Longimicrobium sp. TaxID=2029185 RepID=UPI002BF44BAA|nr:DNA repair protein RecO [Longimicrobium sp.]HSU17315.1 DNA repair protein RecO [Longimicrobium sp.]
MALANTRALVLQSFPYSESSKVLRLFTLEHGLRSVMAKGALRPKSRYGGVLEPFTEGVATFYLKEGRDLHTLSGFDLLRSRQALGRSLAAFAGASLVAELVLHADTEEANPEIYESLAAAFDAMAAAGDADEALRAALTGAWTLISLLGFEPGTDHCVVCERPLVPAEPVRFDTSAGGVACVRCRPAGRIIPAASRAELHAMVRGRTPEEPLASPGLHRALLRVFLETHVQQDRPFRALPLFLDQMGATVPSESEAEGDGDGEAMDGAR